MSDYKNISVGIINLKLNNIFSIISCIKEIGYKVEIIENKKKIKNDLIILPGVGSFPKAMKFLIKTGLDKSILEFSKTKKPLIGICLGMQLLFDKSEEFKKVKGLSLVEGEVKKIPQKKTIVPNIGWQKINLKKNDKLISNNLDKNFFYFIHSYYCLPKKKNKILSLTKINKFEFCSSIRQDNIYGMQFHPEKSSKSGIKLFSNFRKIL